MSEHAVTVERNTLSGEIKSLGEQGMTSHLPKRGRHGTVVIAIIQVLHVGKYWMYSEKQEITQS